MAENKQVKKLTLEDLISAKIEKDKAKEKTVEVNVKSLGGLVTFVTPPVKFTKKVFNKIQGKNEEEALKAQDSYIYNCCPIVKSNYKKLMDAYEVKGEPTGLVDKLFDAPEQDTIISKLMKLAGYDVEKAQEEIKNS
ncbi:hypothetical protein AB8U03_15690 [Clostridium sp. Mt-5]|uniref:Phage XkdN-like protein n=1 Tax=Clostridium moutaii TaxID=3240932 RepID=A0ABV4BTS5_9CLOT